MPLDPELNKARDEVMRKIGRNMIFYQQMEHMLKHILSQYSYSGYAGDLISNKEKKKSNVSKQTLGKITGEFLKSTNTPYKAPKVDLTKGKGTHFDFAITRKCDPADYQKKKKALEEIVNDRNELAHTFLHNFNLSSVQSCLKIEQYLDEHYEKLLPEHKDLKQFILSSEKSLKNHVEYLKSGKYLEDFKLAKLRQNRVCILLAEITETSSRPDGWTLLSVAGKIIHKEMKEVLLSTYEEHNYKQLKEFLLATKVFDIQEEQTDKGGKRILYRLKETWAIEKIPLHDDTESQSKSDTITISTEFSGNMITTKY